MYDAKEIRHCNACLAPLRRSGWSSRDSPCDTWRSWHSAGSHLDGAEAHEQLSRLLRLAADDIRGAPACILPDQPLLHDRRGAQQPEGEGNRDRRVLAGCRDSGHGHRDNMDIERLRGHAHIDEEPGCLADRDKQGLHQSDPEYVPIPVRKQLIRILRSSRKSYEHSLQRHSGKGGAAE